MKFLHKTIIVFTIEGIERVSHSRRGIEEEELATSDVSVVEELQKNRRSKNI